MDILSLYGTQRNTNSPYTIVGLSLEPTLDLTLEYVGLAIDQP